MSAAPPAAGETQPSSDHDDAALPQLAPIS